MFRLLPVFLHAALSAALFAQAPGRLTALDRYVAAPDSNYKYELARTIPGPGVTAHVIDMTSQAWRTGAEVDRPVWKHWLTIILPEKTGTATGLLFIGGGNNDGKQPSLPDRSLIEMAAATGSVVAELRMVPNQPLAFPGGAKGRFEDSLIAYTWDKFLRGGDENWPARLPMTKSAVRAMDTITAFCASEKGGGVKVEKFVVAGASKRGWTTWAAAAVDKRVAAIIPIVIDVLNVEPSFVHHWRAYGFWAPAVKDYTQFQIMDWMGKPRNRELMRIEDPYEYRDRLTMPKFILNSAGDQFFLPDSWQFYYPGLKGEKYLRYVPNSDHSLRNTDARESLEAYYAAFLKGTPRPRFDWKIEKNGDIRVKAVDRPTEVKLWAATNPKARDFRLETIKNAYQATPLNESAPGVYVGRVPKPPAGWTAYFVELTYSSGGRYPFRFTTGVKVSPDTLPFPPYKAQPVGK